jgi:hypothetical protein
VTLVRKWIGSPNYSGRGGSAVRLIVLHTAEGSTTIESLGSYFANPASQVSSHTGIDDTPGTVGEFVKRDQKAWTAADANPYSVQTELCAFAAWTPAQWAAHPNMLDNCAKWIAEEAAAFSIPIVRLNATQAQDGRSRGVCQHVDLGSAGGGHWDCGGGFPMDQVITQAVHGSSAPAPEEDDSMPKQWLLQDGDSGGYWQLYEDGGIAAYDGAPYLGGVNNHQYNAAGWPVAGLAQFSDRNGEGYCITLDAGKAGGDRFRRYRFPRDASARV